MSERWKAFILTPEQVVELLSGRTRCLGGIVPESARVVRYAYRWETHTAVIILTDESFPLLKNGFMEPVAVETVEREYP